MPTSLGVPFCKPQALSRHTLYTQHIATTSQQHRNIIATAFTAPHNTFTMQTIRAPLPAACIKHSRVATRSARMALRTRASIDNGVPQTENKVLS